MPPGGVCIIITERYALDHMSGRSENPRKPRVRYTLFAFFVAVLAGLGSVSGALIAALLLGVVEAFVATYVGSSYSLLAIFTTLLVALLISPRGILRRGL